MHPEPVVLRSHYARDGSVESIEVLEAPALSCITVELLDAMDPRWRHPEDPTVLVLAPDVRYRIGALVQEHGVRFLYRI